MLQKSGWNITFYTILIFDKNYKFLDVAYQQLTATGTINASYTVKEAGYAFLYVSNEQQNQTDVYIDDVTMSYTPTSILQSNEYYPFGLQTANSWTRDNTTNKFLYDGGSELNSTTGMYDLPYRNYDAALGRFFQVDALAQRYSDLTPYHYAGNNPIVGNDPSGLYVDYSNSWSNPAYRNQMEEQAEARKWSQQNSAFFGDASAGPQGGSNYGSPRTPFSVFISGDGQSSLSLSGFAAQNLFRTLAAGGGVVVDAGGAVYFVNSGDTNVNGVLTPDGVFVSQAQMASVANGLSDISKNIRNSTTFASTSNSNWIPAEDEHWWFDDQGEILFDHWRNGKGKELFLNDPQVWGNYMRAHSGLSDAIENVAGKFTKQGAFSGVMSFDFGGGYQTGYQLLGGSNSRVGGLSYSGYLSINGDELNYHVNLVWNDVEDPTKSWDDKIGNWFFPGTPYIVHISWSYDFTSYKFDKK